MISFFRLMLLIVYIFLFALLFLVVADITDDGYDDEYVYYEDNSADTTSDTIMSSGESIDRSINRASNQAYNNNDLNQISKAIPKSPASHLIPAQRTSFLRPVGTAKVVIKSPIISDSYVNETIAKYQCFPRQRARIKISEEEERLQKEEEKKVKIIVDPKLEQKRDMFRDEINALMKSSQVLKEQRMAQQKSLLGAGGSILKHSEPGTIPRNSSEDSEVEAVGNETSTSNITLLEANNSTASKRITPQRKLRMQFRMNEIEKKQRKLQQHLVRESKIQKFKLGPDCESMICGACKIIVEEFAWAAHRALGNPEIKYVEEVFKGFCETNEVSRKYHDIVADVCKKQFSEPQTGYEEALIQAFEHDETLEFVLDPGSIFDKKLEVCMTVGACWEEHFQLKVIPLHREEEQWDSKCFVCQAFANDIEEQLALTRLPTESVVNSIVRATCNRLYLDDEYHGICESILQDPHLEEVVSWEAGVHNEAVQRQQKGEVRFADSLCESIKFCVKWMPPSVLKLQTDIAALQDHVYD